MSEWQERSFEFRGMRFAAKCWHDPSKPLLLALHGWLDNAASYDRIAPLLPDYHIVALDFAGHGLSDHRPPHTRYHTLDHIDDVYAVAQQLGRERFVLMGHSMGAGVASLFAGTFPEKIEKLVLIEGIGTYGGEGDKAPEVLRAAIEQWDAYQDGVRVIPDMASAIKAWQMGLSRLSEAAATLLCARGVKAVEGGYCWATDKRLKLHSTLRLDESQVNGFLRAITAPTLLVLAEHGLPVDQGKYAARLEAHHHLELRKLPGGHHLHLDQSPELVAETIRGFLAKPSRA